MSGYYWHAAGTFHKSYFAMKAINGFFSSYFEGLTIYPRLDLGGISLLTVPLTGYCNGKMVNCLFIKTTIRAALS